MYLMILLAGLLVGVESWSTFGASWKRRTNIQLNSVSAKTSNVDFSGAYPSGGAGAFERALMCLSPGTSEDGCSLADMESYFRVLDSELVRSECSPIQEAVIDDLWRLIKMMYNGATRQEAIAARESFTLSASASQVYDVALKYLNPGTVEAKTCSIDNLKYAFNVLDAEMNRADCSDAQRQVLEQLEKVLKCAADGNKVQDAIKQMWDARDSAARSRLRAAAAFSGVYPSGGADAFERALLCLSPETSEDGCSLADMESYFRVLDSELVRGQCSPIQEAVIDDLWRLIKMMYGGATRQEALAARESFTLSASASQVYDVVLKYLNPGTVEAKTCSIDNLKYAFNILDAEMNRADCSAAQRQVLEQLEKVIKCAANGNKVQDAIKQMWDARDSAARTRLRAAAAFSGAYPAEGAGAFERALVCLSPETDEDKCTLAKMESYFRVLDSESVRGQCSPVQEAVIDDLWRLIKMMYGGATRQEALAARESFTLSASASQVYDVVLKYLNPETVEAKTCSIDNLKYAFNVLDAEMNRADCSYAQRQVLEQLEKVLKCVGNGNKVQAAIKQTWEARETAARSLLRTVP